MKVGQKVQWTLISKRGRNINMRLVSGVVESVRDGIATVKRGRSTRNEVPIEKLQIEGTDEKSELTDFVEHIFAANRRTR